MMTIATEPGTVTFNSQPLTLAESGWNTWTADGITLRILPTALWGASRTGHYPAGSNTPQEALDQLAAAEAKAEHAAAIRAGLTDGQRFTRDMRAHLHIGANTRRYRDNIDLHAEILRASMELVISGREYGYSEQLVEAARPAFGALLAYDKHIASWRLGGLICQYVNSLTPWELLDLLGEMVDAGIKHVGGGERWLQDMAKTLTVTATNSITGYQTITRAA